MSVRHLNYTDRKRIKRLDIDIQLEKNGEVLDFEAGFDLSNYAFPDNARVFMEAYRQTSFMRFNFGTIADIKPPESTELTEFDGSYQGIKFRARVTLPKDPRGLELGEADAIHPEPPDEAEEDQISLLPVIGAELDQSVFKLEFHDEPVLLINDRSGDWREVVKQPAFQSLVLPNVIREVLTRIIFIEEYYETTDLSDWRSQWLNYALSLPGIQDIPEDEDDWGVADWIDDAAEAFCDKFEVTDLFKEYWTAEVE